MKWLAMMMMVVAMLAVSPVSFGQQAVGTLKDGEKCTSDAGCKCVNADVKKNCTCKITLGSGTANCDVLDGGGPKPFEIVLWALAGAVFGSVLTYAVLRRRRAREF